MAQWININQNNSFVNRTCLPLLCEQAGAILLVLVGLTIDTIVYIISMVLQQAGQQSDHIIKYGSS